MYEEYDRPLREIIEDIDNYNLSIKECGEIIQLEPITEAYFKESNEMKELVKTLKSILNITHKYTPLDSKFKKFTKLKEVTKFNRQMENMFGFHTFSLEIYESSTINAFTYPVSFKYDNVTSNGKRNVVMTKTGYKFVKGSNYNAIVFITSKFLSDNRFNERDIMGVILHEVGHNFSFAINNGATAFGVMAKIDNLLYLINNYIYVWALDYDQVYDNSKAIYNDPDESALIKLAEHIKKKDNLFINISTSIFRPLCYIVDFFATLGIAMYYLFGGLFIDIIIGFLDRNVNPIGILYQFFGYNDEKISDNFATMYGFGKEVAKFEESIYSISKEELKKQGFLMKLMNIIVLPLQLLMIAGDPHPRAITRIIDQINILEMELDKQELDPKMKEQIKSDIREIKKQLDKYYESVEKNDSKASVLYNKLMEKLFEGDWRQLVMKTKKNVYQYDAVKKGDVR